MPKDTVMHYHSELPIGGTEMEGRNSELELVDLGAISAQTRGIEPLGAVEEDTGERYIFAAGIAETD
jgi:hypothetical protein